MPPPPTLPPWYEGSFSRSTSAATAAAAAAAVRSRSMLGVTASPPCAESPPQPTPPTLPRATAGNNRTGAAEGWRKSSSGHAASSSAACSCMEKLRPSVWTVWESVCVEESFIGPTPLGQSVSEGPGGFTLHRRVHPSAAGCPERFHCVRAPPGLVVRQAGSVEEATGTQLAWRRRLASEAPEHARDHLANVPGGFNSSATVPRVRSTHGNWRPGNMCGSTRIARISKWK
eukprot:366193-Chlamydomonas_euryale.AAC.6